MPPRSFVSPHANIRSRGYLPHWELPEATYFVTFRLADSLPKHVAETLKRERDALAEIHFGLRLDEALDRGCGSGALANPRIADAVAGALRYFDGSRYELLTWCVMPNHVHVLARMHDSLAGVLHSWKSFTSHRAEKLQGTTGRFWAREYFDRIIRNDQDLANVSQYIMRNPEKAGLRDWPWKGTIF